MVVVLSVLLGIYLGWLSAFVAVAMAFSFRHAIFLLFELERRLKAK